MHTIKQLFTDFKKTLKDDTQALIKGVDYYMGFIQFNPSKLLQGLDQELGHWSVTREQLTAEFKLKFAGI